MSALKLYRRAAPPTLLALVGAFSLVAHHALATHYYFDLNGTTTGSGITDGGSYTWEGTKWNSNLNGNTTAPIAWPEGNNFPQFAAGTDALSSNYTITASSNHTFAGMALQSDGGGIVTITASGGAVLSLFSASGGQGIFVGGVNSQNLVISATIGGDSITPLVWQGLLTGIAGSLSLYGNNTFGGGVDLNTSGALNFNNINSFGTGPIRWGFTGGTATQFTVAAPDATSPITIANSMVTKAADTLTMTQFANPVTWSGPWTLASGISTLDIRSNANTTISGMISGSGGALTKTSTGTLTLTAANTYTGATTISNGTIDVAGASANLGTGNVSVAGTGSLLSIESGVTDAINNSASLSLANSGILNLAAGVNERVATLSLDGAFQSPGTYGSSQSSAVNKLDFYFMGTGILTVGTPILAGDYNNNGVVDAADYVTWRANVGQPSQTLPNDTTGVIIGGPQYDQWRLNFANTLPVPGAGASFGAESVPEPASSAALVIGLLGWAVGISSLRLRNGYSRQL